MPSFGHSYDSIPAGNTLLRSASTQFIDKNNFANSQPRTDSQYNSSYPLNLKASNQPDRRSSLAKLKDFRKKVHEVIDLCAHQNTDAKTDLSQVVNEERKVYEMFVQNPSLLRRTVSHQSFPHVPLQMQSTLPYNQSQLGQQQNPGQMTTPFRPQKQQKQPQSQYYIQNSSQVAFRESQYPQSNPYSNAPKREPGVNYSEFPGAQYGQSNLNAENLQSSFVRLKNHSQVQLNPDALQLIEQIERKAFQEIQKLRKQKIQLMQQLNQQIRNVNEQKKKNAELQKVVARLNNQPQNSNGLNQQNNEHFQTQINRLQEQLQRANQISHNLRLELSNRGSGVPGIQELLRQGEAIRQETLRLIKIKEQGDVGNFKIQQLQRRLNAERVEKQSVMNELSLLREKLGVSQMRSYQEIKHNQKSGIRNHGPQPVKTVGQYEDLVSEMKRITGF